MLPVNDETHWAATTFGDAPLGDPRRTVRLVRLATALATQPAASLPQQTGSWTELVGAYRLLGNAAIDYPAILAPVLQQTQEAVAAQPLVLLVGDTTELDYSHFPSIADLGPIGEGTTRGYLLHSTLAVTPERTVLGLLHLQPWVRPTPATPPATGKRAQAARTRAKPRNERESRVWEQSVAALGRVPPERRWLYVSDRGSDIYSYLAACRAQGAGFVVRAMRNRRLQDETALLLDYARALPAQSERTLELAAGHGRPARTTRLAVAHVPVTLQPPEALPAHPPLPVWLIRVWEPEAPADGGEPVDWLLLSSEPAATSEAVWEQVGWYQCRWVIEEYHTGLKTGCRLEARRLDDRAALWRLLALCAPLAVRLLQLRDQARQQPDQPATQVLDPAVVTLVATLRHLPPEACTVGRITREIATFGGYLGRTRDGPPGWQTLWRGWQHIQTLLAGVHLAARLPPATSV